MKKKLTPRLAAVHDLSCIGRCSLTVIMPVLAALGIQVCPLPTAVLSSHLGGFTGWEFCDFTEMMPAFLRHWQQEGLSFDCIYSGFLASERQMEIVGDFIAAASGASSSRPLIVVDPVMGDDGHLYTTYTPQMQAGMKKLVQAAQVITPNYTEACFLLDRSYQDFVTKPGDLRVWAEELALLGPEIVVITGIPLSQGKIGTIGYNRTDDFFWEITDTQIAARYPGTGDIFASVLLGSLLQGDSLQVSLERAVNFVAFTVKQTFAAGTPRREGVLLEAALPKLSREFWREREQLLFP